jgi:GNAT superfamily N-acetyltransferase
MNVAIRLATIDDLPSVISLYSQADMDNKNVTTLENAKHIFESFKQYPNYHLYVAYYPSSDNKIVGTFALLVMQNIGHHGTPSAIVEDVVVSESHQSQTIGSNMMKFAMELAKQAGCYKLVLSSNQKRQRAHAFYESLGFQKHGYSFQVQL